MESKLGITTSVLISVVTQLTLVLSGSAMQCPQFKDFVSKVNMKFKSTFSLNETNFCKFKSCMAMECSGLLPYLPETTKAHEKANFSVAVNSCKKEIFISGTAAGATFGAYLKNNDKETIIDTPHAGRTKSYLSMKMLELPNNLLNLSVTADIRAFGKGGFKHIEIVLFDGTIENLCSLITTTSTPQTTRARVTSGSSATTTILTSTSAVTTTTTTKTTATTTATATAGTTTTARTTMQPSTTVQPPSTKLATTKPFSTITEPTKALPSRTPHRSTEKVGTQVLMYIMGVGVLGVVVLSGFYFWRKRRIARRSGHISVQNEYEEDDAPIVPHF